MNVIIRDVDVIDVGLCVCVCVCVCACVCVRACESVTKMLQVQCL